MARKFKLSKKPRRPELQGTYKKQAVFSYRSSRREEARSFDRGGSSEQKQESQRSFGWWLRHSPYMLCGLVIFTAFLYSLVVDTHAQLDIVGTQAYPRDVAEYQTSIDDKLASSVFNRVKPTLNTPKLASQIEAEFPELQEVVVNVPLFRHRPVVEFRLAKPTALVVSDEITYVVDGEGRALFNAKNKSDALDTASLPTVLDGTGAKVSLGKPLLSGDQVAYVREIYLQASAKNMQVESVELKAGGEELQVRFVSKNYNIRFNIQADARKSMGAYFAVSDKLIGEGSKPAEYIDVRIPERVFVK